MMKNSNYHFENKNNNNKQSEQIKTIPKIKENKFLISKPYEVKALDDLKVLPIIENHYRSQNHTYINVGDKITNASENCFKRSLRTNKYKSNEISTIKDNDACFHKTKQ
jgi:hypothetical protein